MKHPPLLDRFLPRVGLVLLGATLGLPAACDDSSAEPPAADGSSHADVTDGDAPAPADIVDATPDEPDDGPSSDARDARPPDAVLDIVDAEDGDVEDGDAEDGDAEDGDVEDGDAADVDPGPEVDAEVDAVDPHPPRRGCRTFGSFAERSVLSSELEWVPSGRELQGEAVAWEPGGRAYWHAAEGRGSALYRVACEEEGDGGESGGR